MCSDQDQTKTKQRQLFTVRFREKFVEIQTFHWMYN